MARRPRSSTQHRRSLLGWTRTRSGATPLEWHSSLAVASYPTPRPKPPLRWLVAIGRCLASGAAARSANGSTRAIAATPNLRNRFTPAGCDGLTRLSQLQAARPHTELRNPSRRTTWRTTGHKRRTALPAHEFGGQSILPPCFPCRNAHRGRHRKRSSCAGRRRQKRLALEGPTNDWPPKGQSSQPVEVRSSEGLGINAAAQTPQGAVASRCS